MYADIHVLQTVPPSNINRDDTGSPKSAVYGGALRARVSSQAWKRAMREMFPELLPEGSLGVRTKMAVSLIESELLRKRPDLAVEANKLAVAVLQATGVKVKASDRKGSDEGSSVTEYLIYISRSELEKLAGVAIGWRDADFDISKVDKQMKKEVASIFHGTQAVDIALFGRMLADAPDLNTDASAQVAHAISVDRIAQDYDYFTAVDDCAADDNMGAGMIGSVGFNSSTLYRYANVNLDSLHEQLGDAEATAQGLMAFVEAFVKSMPTGKQNTFANRTLPSTVVVTFRTGQPINASSAFEVPVRASERESVTALATKRLFKRLREIEEVFDEPSSKAWSVVLDGGDGDVPTFGERVDFKTLTDSVHDEALGLFSEEQ